MVHKLNDKTQRYNVIVVKVTSIQPCFQGFSLFVGDGKEEKNPGNELNLHTKHKLRQVFQTPLVLLFKST